MTERADSGQQSAMLPAALSHELRTPVTSIYSAATMLRADEGKLGAEERSDLIGEIAQESERLLRLLDDLLVTSDLDVGIQLLQEPTLLQRVVPAAVAREIRRRPGLHVETTIENGLPVVIACEASVQQVVRNLISNAARHGPGDPIEIRVTWDAEHEGVKTRVLDRGEDVPGTEIEAIFRPFYRSLRSNRSATGTGLGLYVCRGLIEAMGGRVWGHARDGGGSEFGFWLPRYVPGLEDEL